METLAQDTEKQMDETIRFRCTAKFRRAVRMSAADQGISIQRLCTRLIAQGLSRTDLLTEQPTEDADEN